VDLADIWVCKHAFAIFCTERAGPQPAVTAAPGGSQASAVPSPPASAGWIGRLPHRSLFPFQLNTRTSLLAVPAILECPQPEYDYPTGTGVLVKFPELELASNPDPKSLIRDEVQFSFTVLLSGANKYQQLLQSYTTGNGGTPCQVPEVFGPGRVPSKRVPLTCNGVKACLYWSSVPGESAAAFVEHYNQADVHNTAIANSYTLM
jgi:hypothetical protein